MGTFDMVFGSRSISQVPSRDLAQGPGGAPGGAPGTPNFHKTRIFTKLLKYEPVGGKPTPGNKNFKVSCSKTRFFKSESLGTGGSSRNTPW